MYIPSCIHTGIDLDLPMHLHISRNDTAIVFSYCFLSKIRMLVLPYIQTIAVVLSVVAVVWLIVSIAGEGWVIVRFLYFEDQTWTWGLWNTCNKLEEAFTVCIKEGKDCFS